MCFNEFQMGMLSRMRNGYRSDNFLLGILCLELLQLRISLEEARSRNSIEIFQFGVTAPNLRTAQFWGPYPWGEGGFRCTWHLTHIYYIILV